MQRFSHISQQHNNTNDEVRDTGMHVDIELCKCPEGLTLGTRRPVNKERPMIINNNMHESPFQSIVVVIIYADASRCEIFHHVDCCGAASFHDECPHFGLL